MRSKLPIWSTIVIAVISFAAGCLIDRQFVSSPAVTDGTDPKVKAILDLISREYVDTVNPEDFMERSIPLLLRGLDPHTSYIDGQHSRKTIDEPDGVIPDIGIVFITINDTLFVECTVPDGPSDKAGIMPGDRIISLDGKSLTEGNMSTGQVMRLMSGPNGSKLVMGVHRDGYEKPLAFTITRDRIKERSIGAYFMMDKTTGYVKVNRFEGSTHNDFVKALSQLRDEGAKRYLIDLRGNGGGYLAIAVLMANEFLPSGQTIVETRGRHKRYEKTYKSDGKGEFQNAEVAVLIDEFSASASEVFAGALQDNDRGLIVGRRSYGKGLVQKDFTLPDSSILRLAVARYHTPSGRCIQKEFTRDYRQELLKRYHHGEVYSRDSMTIDKSQRFTTRHGRTVYGGGGIIPDIFVAFDIEGITNYYIEVKNSGLLQRFAYTYCEKNRTTLNQMSDYKQFLRTTPIDDTLIKEFADFASAEGFAPRWGSINQSRDVILTSLKAQVARDIFGPMAYSYILNRNDLTVQTALKALNRHKAAFPITD